ncbi:MAG: hypothetical protein MPJ50_10050 [Pirellulales bacterium]|nr:hypothetical protein [Pirellulales bacterium]
MDDSRQAISDAHKTNPTQFGIGHLMGVIWLIGCWLGGFLNGMVFFSAAALPLGLIGYGVLARRVPWRNRQRAWRTATCFILCALLLPPIFRVGTPGDFISWMIIWTLAIYSFAPQPGLHLFAAVVGMQAFVTASCADPVLVSNLFGIRRQIAFPEFRGTRQGQLIGPIFLMTKTLNTPLIEKYVPSIEQKPLNPFSSIEGELLLYDPELKDILALLPHDQARTAVLAALVDDKNHLRFHQNMVMYAIQALGYPAGETAESWWQSHAEIFAVEHDPDRAAERAWGWGFHLEMCHVRAVSFHLRFRRSYRAASRQEVTDMQGTPGFASAWTRLSSALAHDPQRAKALKNRNEQLLRW